MSKKGKPGDGIHTLGVRSGGIWNNVPEKFVGWFFSIVKNLMKR